MVELFHLESDLQKNSDDLFALYLKLKSWAVAIWSDHVDIPDQIRHGTSHSEKVLGYADVILSRKRTEQLFSDQEIFLLLTSVMLHDIGMQIGWKKYLHIKGDRGHLSPEERRTIRKRHAETTAHVIRSFKKESLPAFLSDELNNREKKMLCQDLNEPLAIVCEAHNKEDIGNYIDREVNQRVPGTPLKLHLLGAILQFCDAMHMDKSRLNEPMFLDALEKWLKGDVIEAAYEPEDWKRFFQCYYVEECVISPLKRFGNVFRIEVGVQFNMDERRDMSEQFLDIYERRLTQSRDGCVTILNQVADIHFLSDSPFKVKPPSSTKRPLPEKLFSIFSDIEKPKPKKITSQKGLVSPHFVGRDSDISTIKEKIADFPGKVISIVGAPGIGKTELVLAVVEEMAAHFKDGLKFISLEGIITKDTAISKINMVVQNSESANELALFNSFEGKQYLIVLDNFEDTLHDRSATITFLKKLTKKAVTSRILLTSREALNDASFEEIHKVDKLSRKDSKALLKELSRAQECTHEFADDEMDVLLDELDDVPLAIVLAAPYVKYGVRQLVESLQTKGIDTLRIPGIADDEATKEQSLGKSLALSYMTIKGTDAEGLFQVCSFFPSGMELEDAYRILPELRRQSVVVLASKSLMDFAGKDRYQMLAPIRSFAFKTFMANPKRIALADRWANVILEKSKAYDEKTRGMGEKISEELVYELPNVFNAINYLLEQGVKEKERILQIISNITNFLRFSGIHEEAKRYLEQGKTVARKTKDISGEANCIQSLGDIHFIESRNKEAKAAFEQALPLYRKVGDVLGEANCIQSLGGIHFIESRNKEAKAAFEQALPLYRKVGAVLGEANCIQRLGGIHFIESRNKEAKAAFEQALPLYRKVGAVLGEANCIQSLGGIHFIESRNKEAKAAFEQALPLYRKVGDVLGEANCIQRLGDIHFRESRNKEAKAAFEQALPLYRKVGAVLGEANCIQSLGDIHFIESRNKEAKAAFEQALPLYRKVGDVLGEANCIQSLGGIHFIESRNKEAKAAFEQALPLYRKVGDVLGEANCIQSLGKILVNKGDLKGGWAHFRDAVTLYEQINDRYSIGVAFYALGSLLKGISQHRHEACEWFQKAEDVFSSINLQGLADTCKKLASE